MTVTTFSSPAGGYARLTQGATYVRVDGPEDGHPIVLLHGATVPHWEFDLLVAELTAVGFRTLRFDYYGHGLSERPRTRYTLSLFSRQTVELLERTDFGPPAAMVGHSLGAAVACGVIAARPDLADRVVLAAPMLCFEALGAWLTAFRCPGLGEALMRVVGLPALIRRRRARYESIGLPELARRFEEQSSDPGCARALLSMLRTDALGDQSGCYAGLAGTGRPVLVVSGAHDSVTTPEQVERIRALLPRHAHLRIEDAGHNLVLTHAPVISEALNRFVDRTRRPDEQAQRRARRDE